MQPCENLSQIPLLLPNLHSHLMPSPALQGSKPGLAAVRPGAGRRHFMPRAPCGAGQEERVLGGTGTQEEVPVSRWGGSGMKVVPGCIHPGCGVWAHGEDQR